MSLQEIVVAGTLEADGTVKLDHKPNLAPGRVTVVLRQEAKEAPQEDWWQFMQRTRRELDAAGSRFMNEAEVHAHLEWLREGDWIDSMLREAEEDHPERGQP